MTDSSKYTGIHKARFDEDGHGRGIAGRDLAGKGDSIKLCHLRVIGLAALNVFALLLQLSDQSCCCGVPSQLAFSALLSRQQ